MAGKQNWGACVVVGRAQARQAGLLHAREARGKLVGTSPQGWFGWHSVVADIEVRVAVKPSVFMTINGIYACPQSSFSSSASSKTSSW